MLSINRRKKQPVDLLSIDFATSATKVVKLKYNKNKLSLTGTALLPPVNLADRGSKPTALEIPRDMKANYASACVSNSAAMAKMINLPPQTDPEKVASQIKEQFNIDDDYRISSISLATAKSRSGNKLVAAAIPEHQISKLLAITASSPPALRSCEVASLAALQAFLVSSRAQADDGIGFIEMGEITTNIFFVHRRNLILLRQYDVGSRLITDRIVNDFHVDRQTAANIMTEGAIDLSSLYSEILGFLVRQIVLSKDFVERQEKCRIAALVISGGMSCSKTWTSLLEEDTAIQVEPFNPFEQVQIDSTLVSSEWHACPGRFTAAIGAAIGEYGIA